MPAPTSVRREIVLDASRDEAWRALTDERVLADWLADEVELEPEPGGRVEARWRDGAERVGEVEQVEPGESLVLRWADPERPWLASRVAFRLDEAEGGTRVAVVERPLDARATVTLEIASRTWGPRLSALSASAAVALA
jgi:uncharacterized protein YndB with AHSA1/START domain